MNPLRTFSDADCLGAEADLISAIDANGLVYWRDSWAVGLHSLYASPPKNGCVRVARTRDMNAYAYTYAQAHSSRRWVAVALYNDFAFSRKQITQNEIWVHVEPIFRMPGLRIYAGLLYGAKNDSQGPNREPVFINDNISPHRTHHVSRP